MVTGDKCCIHILSSSLSPQSFSGSLHNVTEGTSSGSSSPSLSRSSCSSSHPDLTSPSLVLNPDPSSSSSSSCSPRALPVYNKQVSDSCIIRVSVECVSNGNVYKSIVVRLVIWYICSLKVSQNVFGKLCSKIRN